MSHSSQTTASIIILLTVISGLGNEAAGSEGPPPVLNPKTYVSPSGEYSLRVTPSDIHGRGAGDYVLTTNGEEVWSGEKPYTLWEAGVTDAGLTCGYGYTHGWRGFARKGGYKAGMGDFHVVVLDATGMEILNEVTKRKASRYLHTPPDPLARGMVVDQENDRFTVRVRDPDTNTRRETWRAYQLSTGDQLEHLDPKQAIADGHTLTGSVTARHVPGTPLTLVHWWRFERLAGTSRSGAAFSLIDNAGHPVWHLDLPSDYSIPGDTTAQARLRREIREEGAILRADVPGQFELRFVADDVRVTFQAKRGDRGEWLINEVSRVPYQRPQADGPPAFSLTEYQARPLTPLLLKPKDESETHPVRDVWSFALDDKGRVCFLRGSADAPALVLVDERGNVAKEVPLDSIKPIKGARWTGHTWVGGERYILTCSEYGVGGQASAWWVDMGTGTVKAIEAFDCPAVESIAGYPDGSFVVLATTHHRASMTTTVHAFDALGQRTWSLQQSYDKAPEHLFSPEDIAVTTTGNVVVLDVIRKTVQLFDKSGQYLRTVELESAWGRKPTYPCEIAADIDDGFVIRDFSGKPPIVRMRAEGTILSELEPRHPNDRIVRVRDLRVAPDGRVWTSDSHSLLRLTNDGVVDEVIGLRPDPDQLGEVAGVTIDQSGNIYAVGRRTGAIHVFDPDGHWLRSCNPEPTDLHGDVALPRVTVGEEGQVYMHGAIGLNQKRGYLGFSRTCERISMTGLPEEALRLKWYSQPGTGRTWGLGYENVYLLDRSFATVRTIMRRPDGNWLEKPHSAGVAPDGSIAVAAHSKKLRGDDRATVNLYDAEGEPIRTFKVPSTMGRFLQVAYDGQRVVVAGKDCVLCLDATGDSARQLLINYESEKEPYWYPFLVSSGTELLLFDGNRRSPVLQRYPLP